MPGYSSRIEPFADDDEGNKTQIDPAAAFVKTGPLIKPVTLTLLDAHQRAARQRRREVNLVTGAVLIDTGSSRTGFDVDAATQARLPVIGVDRSGRVLGGGKRR